MKSRCWAVISTQGHSAAGHDGPHASQPTAEAARPARFGTIRLVQLSKRPGRPAAERPTGQGTGCRRACAPTRSPYAGAAWCVPPARWPRWKTTAGVSTNVEQRTWRARSQGWGLTEEVAQRWGGGETSA
jgi:hypothetical protein